MSKGGIVSAVREDVPRSVGAGAAAYAVGVAVLYLLSAWVARVLSVLSDLVAIRFTFQLLAGGTPPLGKAVPTWKVVGWVFYNAHLVNVRVADAGAVNGLLTAGGVGYVGFAVPALVLAATGWWLAGQRTLDSAAAGVGVGAALVPGYLTLVLVGGLVVFPHQLDGPGTAGPVGLPTMVLAGVAWPLVFGTAGAVLFVLDDAGDVDVRRWLTSGPVRGAVLGAAAFVVGYNLLLVAVSANYSQIMPDPSGIVEFLLDVLRVELPPPRNVTGWAFYNAHGVEVRIPTGVDANPFDGDGVGLNWGTKNFLSEEAAAMALFAYPPLLLGTAGAVAARGARSFPGAAAAGAATVVGYAPLFLDRAGDFDYVVSIDLRIRTVEITIHLVQDGWLQQAAVVYPLVFGTVGGVVLYHFGPRLPLVGR